MKELEKGKQIDARVDGVEVVLEEIFLNDNMDTRVDPCLRCYLLERVKESDDTLSPKNCFKVVPSCLGRDRKDKKSVYYKLVTKISDANQA